MIKNYAVTQLSSSSHYSADIPQFTRYLGQYYSGNKKEFNELYSSGSEPVKITILQSLAYTDDIDAVNFLIDSITSVDKAISEAAYHSLKIITGTDPAAEMKKEKYDIDVILFFRDYASKMKKL